MTEEQLAAVQGWFAGRLPDGWFTTTEVTIEDDQIVVLGTLPGMDVDEGASPEFRESAAAGRISRFREQTRGPRVAIAQEAEQRFGKWITWGARLDGVTKRFTPGGGGRGPRGRWHQARPWGGGARPGGPGPGWRDAPWWA